MIKFFVILPLLILLVGMQQSSPRIGQDAPNFELRSPKGKKVELAKLKGRMVLIDFWASWCRPCRNENPNVVQAYQKYRKRKFKNGKGFEVFSVSLDRNKEQWIQAIEIDDLKWKYHGWDENGVVSSTYGVSSIPKAFLVDGNGKIVASGSELRGINLHLTLDSYLAD
jgi:thiol-disulfide isomerase/thioredoxin